MIFFLLNLNTVFKAGLLFAVLAPLALLPIRNQDILTSGVLTVLWQVCASFAWFLRPRELATHFETGLPIAGRQFFWAKAVSLLAIIWLPVASCAAFVTVRGPAGNLALRFAEAGALLTLAFVLPWSVRTRQAVISIPVFLALWTAPVLIGPPLMFLLPPRVFLAVVGGAALLAFLRAWVTVPASFQLAPAAAVEQRRGKAWLVHKPAWWPMWRSASPWLALFFFPLGMVAGAFPHPFVLTLLISTALSRLGMRWLHSLPVSPRTLLAVTLVPTVLPFLAGAYAGMRIAHSISGPPFQSIVGVGPSLKGVPGLAFPGTNVPLEFWRHAPGGNVPVIRAPWGETVQPASLSLLGFEFYNPYTSGKAASQRFFDWQFARATRALHGSSIPLDRYEDTAFAGRLPLVTERPRIDLLTLAALLFGCFTSMFLTELAFSHSRRRLSLFTRYLAVNSLLIVPALAACADGFYLSRIRTSVTLPLVRASLLRLSDALPQNSWAAAAIALVPALAMYGLLARQFRQSEMAGLATRPAPLEVL